MLRRFDRLLHSLNALGSLGLAVTVGSSSLLAITSRADAQATHNFSFVQHVTYESGLENEFPSTARVWLPAAGTPLRGMAVFTNMSNNHANIESQRNAAAALGFGVIGTNGSISGMRALDAQRTLDSLMRNASTASGRGQVANLPVVTIGFSGGGNDAAHTSFGAPSRVITYVANRMAPEPVNDAQPGWTGLPGLLLPGANDSNQKVSYVYGAGFKGLATYYGLNTSIREKGGLAAMGVMLGRGHSDDAFDSPPSQGYEFAWYWTARTALARLPGTVASSTPGNPVSLKPLVKTSGWLAETDRYELPGNTTPNGTSPFKSIAAYADFAGDKDTASWLVDKDLAFAFRAAMSNDSSSAARFPGPLNTPLQFTGVTALQSLSQGGTANLSINPRDFASASTITKMDFYDGATFLGTDTVGSDGWGISVPLNEAGIRGFSVIAFRNDGQVRTSFRAVAVQAAVPEPSALAVLAIAGLGLLRRNRGANSFHKRGTHDENLGSAPLLIAPNQVNNLNRVSH